MKKLLSILFFFIYIIGKSQYPLTTTNGSSATKSIALGSSGAVTGFIFQTNFTDTIQANATTYLSGQPGLLIRVNNTDFWVRNQTANAWVKVNGTGGGGTVTGANNGLTLSGANVQLGGSNLIQYSAIGLNGFTLTINHNGVNNAAQSDSNFLRFTNNAAAVSAIDSNVSTGIMFSANSWKSNGGGSSRNVRFTIDEIALTNTVFGSGQLRFKSSVSGNPYVTLYSVDHNGVWQQNFNIQTALIGPSDQNASSLRFGVSALAAITPTTGLALNNIAIGASSLFSHKRGDENIAIGTNALGFDTSGVDNTAIGYRAMLNNINGTGNTAVGSGSLVGNKNGLANVAIGFNALSVSDTSNNVAVGFTAMNSNTKGTLNTAVGNTSLYQNTTGNQNAAVGYNALNANTTGQKNGAFSAAAMEQNTTGSFNTAVGQDAMLHNTTGSNNTTVGYLGNSGNIAGNDNIGIGVNTLQSPNNINAVIAIGNYTGWVDYGGFNRNANNLRHVIMIGTQAWAGYSNLQTYGDDSIFSTKFYGIPQVTDSTGRDVLIFNRSDSTFKRIPSNLIGTIPTFQQTLIAGSQATQNNTIDANSFNFNITNISNSSFIATDGTSTNFLGLHKASASTALGSQASSGSGISAYLQTKWNSGNAYSELSALPANTDGVGNIIRAYSDSIIILTNKSTDSLRIRSTTSGASTGYVWTLKNQNTGSGSWQSLGSIGIPINNLLAATGGNSIDNGAFQQAWNFNGITTQSGGLQLLSSSLSSGTLLYIEPTTTAATGNTQRALQIQIDGANTNSAQTTYGSFIVNHHTGTTSVNVAGYFNANSGSNNYALIVPNSGGSVGIGTSTPAKILEVAGTVRLSALGTAVFDTTTYKPLGISSSGDVIGITSWPSAGGSSITAGYGILLPSTAIILDTTIAVNKAGAQVIVGVKNFTGLNNLFSSNLTLLNGLDIGGDASPNYQGLRLAYNAAGNIATIQAYLSGDKDLRLLANNLNLYGGGGGGLTAIGINTGARVGIGTVNLSATAALHLPAGVAAANGSPLKFSSGTNLTTAEVGSVEFDGKNIYFTPIGTIRKTIPTNIVSRSTAQTAAVASVVTQTVGAADASYIVSANVLVTTATTHSFNVSVTYTDESNVSRTVTLNFSTLAGIISNAAITNVAGTVPYEGAPLHIRCKAATTITIATTGTFSAVVYNVEGSISQIN